MLKLRDIVDYDLRKIVPESAIDDDTYAKIFNDSIEMFGNKPMMDFEMMYKQLEEWRERYYTCHVPRYHHTSKDSLLNSNNCGGLCLMHLYWESGFIAFDGSINEKSLRNGWLND